MADRREIFDVIRHIISLEVSATLKVLLVYLIDRQGENGKCWPKMSRISSDCKLSISSIKRSIKEAEKLGFLEVIRPNSTAPNRSNQYKILIETGFKMSSVTNQTGVKLNPEQGSKRALNRGQNEPPIERTIERTNERPSEKTKKTTNKDPLKEEELRHLDTDRFKTMWREWVQHRKELKKPLTVTSVRRQIKMLLDYSEENAIKIVQNSIVHGWQGLFPEKFEKLSPVVQVRPVRVTSEVTKAFVDRQKKLLKA